MGKTSYVLKVVPEPFLFICTDVSNPTVAKLKGVPNTDEGLAYVKAHPTKTMILRCYHKNPKLLEVCKDHRRAIVLDEIANLFYTRAMMEELADWAREVRYKDGGLLAWATTQRAAADVLPAIYKAARRIQWVGPLCEESDQKTLYGRRITNWEGGFERFQQQLENLKPYKWDKPNEAESILTVKDLV